MSRLTESNRIVFVEPQRDPDVSYLSDLWQSWPHFGSLSVQPVSKNLEVVRTPPALPYFRRYLPRSVLRYLVPLVALVNNRLMLWHLKRVTRELKVHHPILWLYSPRQVGLIGRFGEKLACYYNYDEFAEFERNRRIRELLQEYDERICKRVDVVFATSQAQFRRRKPVNPHTYFVPNGVDYPLYSLALDPATLIPPDIKDLPRPIVGYVGWLGPHIDVELLVTLARAYPKTSFVLVGPCALKQDHLWIELRSRANVLVTGRKRRQALPGYLKAFDAALMPDIVAGHRLSAYPLKLHEYLAAGCSIVATNLPELEPFRNALRIAETREDFVRLLPVAIADNSPSRVRKRTEIARLNGWDQRVKTLSQVVDAHLSANTSELQATTGPREDSLITLDAR